MLKFDKSKEVKDKQSLNNEFIFSICDVSKLEKFILWSDLHPLNTEIIWLKVDASKFEKSISVIFEQSVKYSEIEIRRLCHTNFIISLLLFI